MLNVGLTGGIASGKSTVAKMFQEKGAYLIDLDVIVRSAEEPGAPVWKRIVEDFGSKILNEDGTINRKKLGAIVFRDKEKLEKLNGIVHPVVFREWKQQIADIKKNDPDAIVVSDIPLLIEVGKVDEVDLVVLVYISQEEQIRRLIERDQCSRSEALARIDSQMPIHKKLWYSDFVVDNGGLLEETAKQVIDIWERFLEREKKI